MELRQFIKKLSEHGIVKRISRSVDWKFEIGEIARKEKNTPLLFENIKDYPGHRLFTGGLSSCSSIAVSLGMEPGITREKLTGILKNRLQTLIQPVMGGRGDDVEVYDGSRVNLFELPVPWWSRKDAGRYIGTWHINVSKDPVSGKRNVGVYRMQIMSRNSTSVSVSPSGHLAMHVKRAEELGRDLELAVGIGVDEMVMMAGGAAVSLGTDEYAVAGSFGGKAIELVECRSVGLEVPLGTEFVLEGVIKKGVRVQDGPYFDYAGVTSINPGAYLFEVKVITRRANPVFRGMSVGMPGAEDHQLFSLLSKLGLADFHGSKLRQKIQNLCLSNGRFGLFQLTGRKGSIVNKLNSIRGKS